MLLLALQGGCDGTAADLVREVDAARDGCTEEMLKSSDEVCVRMFERYADMAAEGMETYIGGLRAFEEAVQRRDGLLFDTTGLGSALGVRWRSGSDSAVSQRQGGSGEPRTSVAGSGFEDRARFDGGEAYNGEAFGPVTGGRWSDPRPVEAAPVPDGWLPDEPGGGRPPVSSPSRSGRGVLLPPEERLRRPWIDGAESPDAYVGEVPRQRDGDPASPVQSPGWGSSPSLRTPQPSSGTWDAY